MRDPEEVAAAFDRAARSAGVAYAFVGGIAVSAWGQPRATQDADCLLDFANGQEEGFMRVLADQGLRVDARDFLDARAEAGHATIFDEDSSFHVECKMVRDDDQRRQIATARVLDLGGFSVRVVGPEETIAYKLRSGSPQDVRDARSIIIRQEGRLDEQMLVDLAQRLGVADALTRLRDESD